MKIKWRTLIEPSREVDVLKAYVWSAILSVNICENLLFTLLNHAGSVKV